jgi:capsular polysaccharide biosynthesis protein
MKRAVSAAISLYPSSWRNRYEHEFRALLDDVSPTWGTFFNVFGGAMKMQFKTGNWWKIVAVCAFAGVIAGAALTWTIPHRYVSTAVLKMGDIDDAQLNAQATKIMARAPLTRLIVEADLYHDLRGTTPIEDIVLKLKTEDITIRHAGEKRFAVSVVAPDPGRAQKATQILTADFLNANVGTLADPASLPVTPDGPRLSRNMVMGLIAGAFAGSLFSLFAGLKVWKLAAGLGIAGAIAGAVIGYVLPDRFSSQAVLRYEGPAAAMGQLVAAVTTDVSLRDVVHRLQLYPGEAGYELSLREHLHIEQVRDGKAIIVRFDDRNRYIAQKVVADVGSRVIDQAVRSKSEIKIVELIDPASLPLRPYFPNRPVAVETGILVGLACAMVLGIWDRFLRSRLAGTLTQ